MQRWSRGGDYNTTDNEVSPSLSVVTTSISYVKALLMMCLPKSVSVFAIWYLLVNIFWELCNELVVTCLF